MMKNNPLDQVILVDEQDQALGFMDKVEAHRHPARLHRASSIFLFRRKQYQQLHAQDSKKPGFKVQLLLQQRSVHKIVGALQWANTVCVNLRPGETYHSAAVRRFKEELGMSGVLLEDCNTFRYQVKCNSTFGENEIDHIFLGWAYTAGVANESSNGEKDRDGTVDYNRSGTPQKIVPNRWEVKTTQWVDWHTLQHLKYNLAPWFELMLQDSSLINTINTWLRQ